MLCMKLSGGCYGKADRTTTIAALRPHPSLDGRRPCAWELHEREMAKVSI
jgi:hypothetical protein